MKRLDPEKKWRQLRLRRRRELRAVARKLGAARHARRAPVIDESPTPWEPDAVTLFANPKQRPRIFRREEAVIRCPDVFSLLDEPEEALRFFRELTTALQNGVTRRLCIDQSRVHQMDLCASTVLEVILRGVRDRLNHLKYYPPEDAEAAEIAWATGLPAMFDLARRSPDRFHVYPLVEGPPKGDSALVSTRKEIEGTLAVEYLNECFEKYDCSLSTEQRTQLCVLITEVLSNSEDHTDSGRWWLAAYLRQNADDFGDCHVTMLNFGDSIGRTMLGLPPDAEIRVACAPTLSALRRRWRIDRSYPEDAFWTVMALQPYASSKERRTIEDQDRGTGTLRILEAFQEIGRSERKGVTPVMALLSGRVHIRMDLKYKTETRVAAAAQDRFLRRIAFNADNDFERPPDPEVVQVLHGGQFPGTILSLRFFIDRKNLERVQNHVHTHS